MRTYLWIMMVALSLTLCGAWGEMAGEYKTIELDGDLGTGWAPRNLLYTGSEISLGMPASSSYSNIYVCNDSDYLYLGFACRGVGGGPITNTWLRQVYIDADSSTNTGYRNDTWMPIGGYDYLAQIGVAGSSYALYSFSGGNDHGDWSWQFIDLLDNDYAATENALELRLDLTLFTNRTGCMRLEFDVTGSGVTSNTYAHQDEGLATTYVPALCGLFRTINLTGTVYEQWTLAETFYGEDEITDGWPRESSYTNIYVAHDDTWLYVGLDAAVPGGVSITNAWYRGIYIDADHDRQTGYTNIGGGGFDYLGEYGNNNGGVMHAFTGASQSEWSWQVVTNMMYSWGSDERDILWAMTRAGFTNLGEQIRLKFSVTGGDVVTQTWASIYSAVKPAKTYSFLPDSASPIDSFDVNGADVVLDWDAANGRMYTVQYRTSLVSGAWTDLAPTNRAGPGAPPFRMSATNEESAAGRFYRIISRD